MKLKKGQLILSEKPFVWTISSGRKGELCDYCCEPKSDGVEKLQWCSGCKVSFYCNRECQKKHWKHHHKGECGWLKGVAPKIPPETVRLVALLLWKLQQGEKTVTDDSEFISLLPINRNFDNLQSHIENIQNDSKRLENFYDLCLLLKGYAGDGLDLSNVKYLMDVFGKVVINSFTLNSAFFQTIGVAIYINSSILDHSCEPNTVQCFSGHRLEVRMLTDADVESAGELRISYVDQLAPTQDRNSTLNELYYFTCHCARCCSTELDAQMLSISCCYCQGPVYVPPITGHRDTVTESAGDTGTDDGEVEVEVLSCGQCGRPQQQDGPSPCPGQSPTAARHLIDRLRADVTSIKAMKSKAAADNNYGGVLRECTRCTQVYTAAGVHRDNVYLVQLVDELVDCCMETEQWDLAMTYAQQQTNIYRRYYGAYHPNVCLQLLAMAKLYLYKEHFDDANKFICMASDAVEVCYGSRHPVMSRQVKELEEECRAGRLLARSGQKMVVPGHQQQAGTSSSTTTLPAITQ